MISVAVLLSWLVAGCGDPSEGDGSTDAQPSAEATGSASQLDALEVFDEEFLRAIGSLQLGVDLAIEEDLQACMKEEGFEYVPLSREELARNLGMDSAGTGETDVLDHFYHAGSALGRLGASDTGAAVSDSDPTESLTPEELEAYVLTRSECLREASRENSNPLASEMNWFGEATGEAASRTEASPEVVAARDEFVQCFSAYGLGTVEEIDQRFFDQVDEVWKQLNADEIDEAEARALLEPIAEDELEVSTAYENCDKPQREVIDRVYAGSFREIAERDSDKAAIWAAELKDEIEPYLARLES